MWPGDHTPASEAPGTEMSNCMYLGAVPGIQEVLSNAHYYGNAAVDAFGPL